MYPDSYSAGGLNAGPGDELDYDGSAWGYGGGDIEPFPYGPVEIRDYGGIPGPIGPRGPRGDAGPVAVTSYEHSQTTPAAVWTIPHALGFNPAGIVVVSSDGYLRDGFGIQYLSAGESLRLSFDVAFAGVAYLS